MIGVIWAAIKIVAVVGVNGSLLDLETCVRDFSQVVEPEQNLADTIQGNTVEISLITAQIRDQNSKC